MPESGLVVGIKDGGVAVVEMERHRECQRCGACAYLQDRDRMVAEVDNAIGAKVGDNVIIDLEPRFLLTAAAIIYLVPVLAFFAGYAVVLVAAAYLGVRFREGAGLVGGLIVLGVWLLLVRRIDQLARAGRKFDPRITGFVRS